MSARSTTTSRRLSGHPSSLVDRGRGSYSKRHIGAPNQPYRWVIGRRRPVTQDLVSDEPEKEVPVSHTPPGACPPWCRTRHDTGLPDAHSRVCAEFATRHGEV